MRDLSIEEALGSHGAAARSLGVTDEQVSRLVSESRRNWRRASRPRRGSITFATGFAALLLAGALAGAATGALNSALDPFFGGGDPPGRSLSEGELPNWLDPAFAEDASVLASDGEHRLIAHRQGGDVCGEYDGHAGECAAPSYWQEELANEPWILRGPTRRDGRSESLFGLVGGSVAKVRLDYASAPSEVVPAADGGFILAVDPQLQPQELVGLNAAGDAVASRDLTNLDDVTGSN